MPPTLKEYFMIDKLIKLRNNIKKIGGFRAAIKQRYLMDQTRAGDLVGTDQFGNKYYEDNTYFMPRNRYVVFPDRVWLDYDGSQVPPEWHRWLHHICDKPPTIEPPVQYKWTLPHQENKTLYLKEKYLPYSTTRPKVEGWVPSTSFNKEKNLLNTKRNIGTLIVVKYSRCELKINDYLKFNAISL